MKQQSYGLCPLDPKGNVCRFTLHSCLFLDVCPQVELNNRQTVSLEIAKGLEETRQQKEDLQTQVSGRTCHTSFNIHNNIKATADVCYTHIYIFYASVQATAVAEGIMVLGCLTTVTLFEHSKIMKDNVK